APAIAGLEAREADLRHRRREIVAGIFREGEKIGIDVGADRVHAKIIRPGVAAAGAIETGERVRAALGERLAQHIARPGARPAAPAGIGTGSIGHQRPPDLFLTCILPAFSGATGSETTPLNGLSGRTAIGAGAEPRLDRVPDRRREIDAVEPV